ncbi:MAG: hypothetical protein J0H81_07360 [Sphingopyxis terrae]|nr:hypothetical protein [Sphingopyxis terrae]
MTLVLPEPSQPMIDTLRVLRGASSHAARISVTTLWRNRLDGLAAGQSLLSASSLRLTASACSSILLERWIRASAAANSE